LKGTDMNRRTLFFAAGALAVPLALSAQGGFGSTQERTAQGSFTWTGPAWQQFLDPQNGSSFAYTGTAYKLEGQSGPVLGRPISADEVRTSTQTLGDGSHITKSETEKFYRDGQGRMRTETATNVIIFDPVAGLTYSLDTAKKTYAKSTAGPHGVVTIAASGSRGGRGVVAGVSSGVAGGAGGGFGGGSGGGSYSTSDSSSSHTSISTTTRMGGQGGSLTAVRTAPSVSAIPGAQESQEDLGQQFISGISAKGSRVTITIPVGALGNDRELKVVNDRWYSDDFKLLLRTSNSDPRFGTTTYELQNVVQGEPSGSLFQPPADYTERR
jgi:hypothetical protein